MAKVLTDGNVKIGAYTFPDRKRPVLAVEKGNTITCYGHFNSAESAENFMRELAILVKAAEE